MESSTHSHFVISRGTKECQDTGEKVTYYKCHRSGKFLTKGTWTYLCQRNCLLEKPLGNLRAELSYVEVYIALQAIRLQGTCNGSKRSLLLLDALHEKLQETPVDEELSSWLNPLLEEAMNKLSNNQSSLQPSSEHANKNVELQKRFFSTERKGIQSTSIHQNCQSQH